MMVAFFHTVKVYTKLHFDLNLQGWSANFLKRSSLDTSQMTGIKGFLKVYVVCIFSIFAYINNVFWLAIFTTF